MAPKSPWGCKTITIPCATAISGYAVHATTMNPKNSCHVLAQASACQRPRLGTEPDSEPQSSAISTRYGPLRSAEISADSALSGLDFLKGTLRVCLRVSASPRQRHSPLGRVPFVLGVLLLLAIPALAATPTTEIKVDQVGYLSGAPKVALLATKTAAKEFTVRSAAGAVAFRAPLPSPVDDPDSGDRVQVADFTALTTPGKYYLDIPGVGRSWEFAIGPDIYARGTIAG